jgi:cell division protein FtsZ
MGIGMGDGDQRAANAAKQAISSPYLERPISGARKLLVNITAGDDLAIGEAEEIVRIVREASDVDDSNVFWGLVFNPSMDERVAVTVVATASTSRRRRSRFRWACRRRVRDQARTPRRTARLRPSCRT